MIGLRIIYLNQICSNRIGGVMVSVLASSVVDRGVEPRSGETRSIKEKEERLVGSESG